MNIAILLSGGTGSRLGSDIPKQYIEVNGKPIFAYAYEALNQSNYIDGIVVVADEGWRDYILNYVYDKKLATNELTLNMLSAATCEDNSVVDQSSNARFLGFADPGQTRQLSIYNALRLIQPKSNDDDLVFIHDAARPILTEQMIATTIDAASGHDGALPVLPMKDTVYLSMDGKSVTKLLDRSTIYAGQAPEVFLLGKYINANEALIADGTIKAINGSTEVAIKAGMDIAMFPGFEENYKITTAIDLQKFKDSIDESISIKDNK